MCGVDCIGGKALVKRPPTRTRAVVMMMAVLEQENILVRVLLFPPTDFSNDACDSFLHMSLAF